MVCWIRDPIDMALWHHSGLHFVNILLRFWLFQSAHGLIIINPVGQKLTCSQGLNNCNVSSGFQFRKNLPDPYGSVVVTQLQLTAALCIAAAKNEYEPCLQITITLQEDVPEGSGGDDEEEASKTNGRALVRVGLSSPLRSEVWKTITFNLSQTPKESTLQEVVSRDQETPWWENQHVTLFIREGMDFAELPYKLSNFLISYSVTDLLLTKTEDKVDFGSVCVVTAESKKADIIQNVTFPVLDEVCHMKSMKNIATCAVPRIHVVAEGDNKVRLQVLNADSKQKDVFCQVDIEGIAEEPFKLPKEKSEIIISPISVIPCLCFQTWWNGDSRRGRYCPFEGREDALKRMQHNLNVTVKKFPPWNDRNELTWNISSLCKLKGEVQLCKNDITGSQCEEVVSSRQRLRDRWAKSNGRYWQSGEFNMSEHPLLCVQVKIEGWKSFSEPQCPFTSSRARWILPLLIGLLLICLVILGAYLIQGVLKGYVWKWLKDDDVKGAVGGGHVLLLYPSDEDDDKRLPGILCHLGSSLQALGFTVSLDLWSQAELSILGPVPWLHSRLDQLQRQGGKVVLVLTRATWTRAEEWGAPSCEKNRGKNQDIEEELGRSYPPPSRRVDVFGASLSCILADYLQGRAGERFTLVQFESLPPEPPGGFRPLPQLFCGLHVYSLPSQSLGFLTELAGTKRMTSASARRKRAGGLRKASRALAQKLSGFTGGTNVFRIAAVSPGCNGVEDSGETVPLKPYLITPPSSPETGLKVGEMDWV